MWVRVGSFDVKPGQASSLRAVYNEQAVPKVRACAGNLACLLLEPSEAGGQFLAMTIWDTQSAGDAYDASGAAAQVVALVREFFAGPPSLRSYESGSVAGFPTPSGSVA